MMNNYIAISLMLIGLSLQAMESHPRIISATRFRTSCDIFELHEIIQKTEDYWDDDSHMKRLLRGIDRYHLWRHFARISPGLIVRAAQVGTPQMMRRMIEAGYDPNFVSYENSCPIAPLFCAAAQGHVAMVRLLLNRGARTLPDDASHKPTVLHAAIYGENNEIMRLLLQRRAIEKAAQGSATQTLSDEAVLLHIAATVENPSMVRFLCQSGFDCNAHIDLSSSNTVLLFRKGDTPLHLAARFGRTRIAQALLLEGAQPSLTNSLGETPYTIAIKKHYSDAARLLLEHGPYPLYDGCGNYSCDNEVARIFEGTPTR